MFEVLHTPEEDLATIRAIGTQTEVDYDMAISKLMEATRQADGTLKAVIDVIGLKGVELGALWKELELDLLNFSDFDASPFWARTAPCNSVRRHRPF